MMILFYRYGSICEPAIIQTFRQNGLTVVEIDDEITNKKIQASERVEIMHNHINQYHPLFVFSINFFPSIADICRIHNILYLCWTVDSPVLELFSNSIRHNTNRIFMFDGAQYEYFSSYNPENIFHLPLAADVSHYNNVISSITPTDLKTYASDISFVGSLYTEKNPLRHLTLSPYNKGYVEGIVNSAMKVYGHNFIQEMVTPALINDFKNAGAAFFNSDNLITNPETYIIAHNYIGYHIAETERIHTLNKMAEHFSVDIYTRSDTTPLKNVRIHNGVHTLTEMPKVFNLSKINLNMTIKPIQTGLPLRIFDIMGCGGFLITNYQSELTDFFEIGTDLEAYASLDELIEKCEFYLEHEDIRTQIALSGYEKVQKYHTYQNRIMEMLIKVVR